MKRIFLTLLLICGLSIYAFADNGWYKHLQDAADVDKTAPTDSQVLMWDSVTKLWVPTTISTDADSITVDTTNFDRNLSSADNTVQKALETLDDMIGGGTGVGSGDVSGPASSQNKGIVRFNGTTGKSIQNSTLVVITDSGSMGIGHTTPTEKLHVVGNILASGSITGNTLSGTGTGITALNASNISSGSVPASSLGTIALTQTSGTLPLANMSIIPLNSGSVSGTLPAANMTIVNLVGNMVSGTLPLANTPVIPLATQVSGVLPDASAPANLSAATLTSGTMPTARLPIVGAPAGSYANASVTVDNYGRVIVAANGADKVNAVNAYLPLTSTGGTAPYVTLTIDNSTLGTNASGQLLVSGANVTSINAANITSGTLPIARLPITGVTPGNYTLTSIGVNAYGQVVSASNGSATGSVMAQDNITINTTASGALQIKAGVGSSGQMLVSDGSALKWAATGAGGSGLTTAVTSVTGTAPVSVTAGTAPVVSLEYPPVKIVNATAPVTVTAGTSPTVGLSYTPVIGVTGSAPVSVTSGTSPVVSLVYTPVEVVKAVLPMSVTAGTLPAASLIYDNKTIGTLAGSGALTISAGSGVAGQMLLSTGTSTVWAGTTTTGTINLTNQVSGTLPYANLGTQISKTAVIMNPVAGTYPGATLSSLNNIKLDKMIAQTIGGINAIFTVDVTTSDGITPAGNISVGQTATTAALNVTSFTGGTIPAGDRLMIYVNSTSGTEVSLTLDFFGHQY